MLFFRPSDRVALSNASYIRDKGRLDDLASYRIVNSEPEVGFDDLILLARLICKAPIATITFVSDTKQWFKAVAGLDFCESSLEESICAHAILQSDALVIKDLSRDSRTRDMRIVKKAPFVRFYAGVPLKTLGGHRIGTICIMDKKPRQGLTLDETLSLEALARQVVCQLLLRQTTHR